MIQRQHLQRSLFEAAIGSIEKLVEGLIEPAFQRLDEVLADEQLVEAVLGRLAQRRPQSCKRGRPGTPVEVVLRILVLKRVKGWSFEQTEHEVRASLVYRYLVRVYFERVPDAKTLIRLSAVIGPEGIEAIHQRLIGMAQQAGLIKGWRARVDTTVVETNISYPADSQLLADGIRVLTRWTRQIEQVTGVVGRKLRNRKRATTRRVLEISRAARSRDFKHARTRLEAGYRRLLALVRATVRDAQRVLSEVASGARVALNQRGRNMIERSQRQVEQMLPLVGRVIAQTRARIFAGDTHYRDKVFSLFEPHTEAIRKGKASKPTEFGKLVKIQEAENQFVVDCQVYARRPEDRTLLIPTIEAHQRIFGRLPHLLAADRGFWSPANQRSAKHAGVEKVCIPALGKISAAQRAEQHQRWFRRGQRFRAGCEGRISVMKRRDGLTRCRYHGLNGIIRWVGWGVISNNLWVFMTAQPRPKRKPRKPLNRPSNQRTIAPTDFCTAN
jgi:transposase, IS5 family